MKIVTTPISVSLCRSVRPFYSRTRTIIPLFLAIKRQERKHDSWRGEEIGGWENSEDLVQSDLVSGTPDRVSRSRHVIGRYCATGDLHDSEQRVRRVDRSAVMVPHCLPVCLRYPSQGYNRFESFETIIFLPFFLLLIKRLYNICNFEGSLANSSPEPELWGIIKRLLRWRNSNDYIAIDREMIRTKSFRVNGKQYH